MTKEDWKGFVCPACAAEVWVSEGLVQWHSAYWYTNGRAGLPYGAHPSGLNCEGSYKPPKRRLKDHLRSVTK